MGDAATGLKMRSIGPALMGGRIADIEVHPAKSSTWYLAVASGGVWKTTNAGISWTPIFDSQASYSIADVSLDPNNPDVVWVGTGENVSGRHVGWGDGVYKSTDAGKNWTNMGLKKSEHIGKILIDPRDSNTVYVASEGPLWSAGGDRGLYKSIDGGGNWNLILEVDQNTGITDIEFHPTNPDVIYAAAYERRRHVWGLLAGGPNGGIYKSSDAGGKWARITTGLPEGDVGKIGLAVTPANPDLVYATIEADSENRGFYRSSDQGESWVKKNSYISGGTGPHYYQELTASPQTADLVYQMDVFMHVTRDGGSHFDYLG
ncbi:MAG: glycosyl hydrolase, partial [Gammaproteobacteria bacterium]|nr:glycosyl hydrolase [Gammaproteobacteria bacterium]